LRDKGNILAALCLSATILFSAWMILGVYLPTALEYNRRFGSRVVMTIDQATFSGMNEQLLILWQNMNASFTGRDYAETYGTPWFWELTYDNSLAAQQDYFRRLAHRLDQYEESWLKFQTNTTNPVLLEDWYAKAINNMREEMKRAGGLDWALKPAWWLTFRPIAYWWAFILVPTDICLIIAALYFHGKNWEWNRRERERSQR